MIGKNNPFNIRYSNSKWLGQIGQIKGFCCFSYIEFGIRAAAYLLIVSYRKRGLKTYAELITRFAPPSENETDYYIKFVTPKGKFPFDCPISLNDFSDMLELMSIFEGNKVSRSVIVKVIKTFFYSYFPDNER